MAKRETLVFIPAWNEESQPVGRPTGAAHRASRRGRARRGRRVDRPDSAHRPRVRGRGALVRREPRPPSGDRRGLRLWRGEGATRFCGRVDADGQHPVGELRRCSSWSARGSCDVAVGSRYATPGGNGSRAIATTRVPRAGSGQGLLRRSIGVVLDRPFHDATSGMYAVNARAMPILARPYTSGAPEVEAVLRLHEEGLRVDEVPVEMRERTSGESKLQGKQALVLVLTVAAR